MKKNIIISGFILVITLGVFVFIYRYQQVSFHFDAPDVGVELYRDNKKITAIRSGETVLLETGMYSVRSTNDKYAKNNIPIDVTNGVKEFPITFSYSSGHLRSLLTNEELGLIRSVLETKYGQKLSSFTLNTGKLLRKGDWYVATLNQHVQDESQIPDTYRVVFKKEKGIWIIATVPSLVLSSPLNPTVPKDILQAANKL